MHYHHTDDEDDDHHDCARLLPPSPTTASKNTNNNYDICPTRSTTHIQHHPPIRIARKLLRRCHQAYNNQPSSGQRPHANATVDKSVYRWLNVRRLDRARLLIFTLCLSFVVYIVFNTVAWSTGAYAGNTDRVIVRVPLDDNDLNNNDNDINHDASKYLVWSSGCVIPSLDPLAADVMRLFHREKYQPCSERLPLTFIETVSTTEMRLRLNRTLLPLYNRKARIDRCCYQRIDRAGENATADFKFSLGHCEPLPFDGTASATLAPDVEFVLVRCKSGTQAVYTNTHAMVRQRPEIRRRLDAFAAKRQQRAADAESTGNGDPTANADAPFVRPLSVLMLSIDSISRLNLLRAMPLTAQHLYDNGWYELQGYNKIDDNTFPNLVAILVGYNNSLVYTNCDPTKVGRLDACPFVWSAFRRAGYVTAYGEDESSINSFNYGEKKGFRQPPTDYYLRPYMLAAERHLPTRKRHSLTFCLGGQHSADHVYQYAVDFAASYAGDPFFGLFWVNTFSHNDLSDPASMDDKMRGYLQQLDRRGVLNDSAVVFFSDHGLRFGPVRHLHTGWLEERLPFIFIWLPEWFRRARPDAVRALRANRNRLTTPYDLHVTLKHVLQMASMDIDAVALSNDVRTNESAAMVPNITTASSVAPPLDAPSCPACQSLFTPMPVNRSCTDAAIAQHWCTCTMYKDYSVRDAIVLGVVRFVLQHINEELKAFDKHQPQRFSTKRRCAHLEMRLVSFAGRATQSNGLEHVYLVVFQASPGDGWFEATVLQNATSGRFRLTGSVSRLNAYASQSDCMPNESLRKFCYCLRKQHG